MWDLTWDEQWVEILALLLAVFGFIISVSMRSSLFTYLTIVLIGFLSGRIYFIRHHQKPTIYFVLIIAGFLFGFLVGGIWTSRILVLAFFFLAFFLSYYLHQKKILVIFKSRNFIK